MLAQIAHVLAGLITALSNTISPVLAILTFLTFMIYELDEDWHIKDKAYKDIREYGLGLFTGTAILLLIHML